MNKQKKKKFKELKSIYGFEIASLTQSNKKLSESLSDEELLDSLVAFDFQTQISNAVEESAQHMDEKLRTVLISKIFFNIIKQLLERDDAESKAILKLELIKYFEENVLGEQ